MCIRLIYVLIIRKSERNLRLKRRVKDRQIYHGDYKACTDKKTMY